MLIKEIGPFHRGTTKSWSKDKRYKSGAPFNICAEEFAEWFDVDESIPLWVQIHDRPAKDRVEVLEGLHDGSTPGEEAGVLRVVTKGGEERPIVVLGGWSGHLNVPYPFYVEIVQDEKGVSLLHIAPRKLS